MTERERDIRKAAKLYKGDKSTLNKLNTENLNLAALSFSINWEFIDFVLKLIIKYGPAIVKEIVEYIKEYN